LYSEAIALCYVSVYEGFGLPPLEAMRCRTPVIYGNNSAMIEVVGEAGLPADADDVEDIREQMRKMILDKELRDALAIKAHHRSFQFSSRKSTYDTLQVYNHIFTLAPRLPAAGRLRRGASIIFTQPKQ
jgi:glycosyltransferase involved in cell wall biosynthesis